MIIRSSEHFDSFGSLDKDLEKQIFFSGAVLLLINSSIASFNYFINTL